MWGAVTRLVTVFVLRLSRGSQVARELLGEGFDGIVVTERYCAYNLVSKLHASFAVFSIRKYVLIPDPTEGRKNGPYVDVDPSVGVIARLSLLCLLELTGR